MKCCPHLDDAISAGDVDLDQVPEAVTMAPSIQTFNVGGQEVRAPCVLPVCVDCRARQMGVVSKTGLVVA